MYLDRIEKCEKLIKSTSVGGFLVVSLAGIRYYSGFRGEDSWLLVINGKSYLLTDGRYITQAENECPQAEILLRTSEKGLIDLVAEVCALNEISSIGIEAGILDAGSYIEGVDLGLDLVPMDKEIALPRAVKSIEEISAIRRACAIADKALEMTLPEIRAGRTELEVARILDFNMFSLGAEEVSFKTIVASGANGALPHAIPSDKVIEVGDLVVIDYGCKVDGYCSDTTRTFAIGKISDEARAVYNLVLAAQIGALGEIKAGRKCSDMHIFARNIFKNAGMAEYFVHSLGHGIGLDIHEYPYLAPSNTETILEVGNIVSDEPGLYLPNKLGVRIEDTVLVSDNGAEALTLFPKELSVL